jgi:hypothetical protein
MLTPLPLAGATLGALGAEGTVAVEAAVTDRLTLAVCVRLPLVPVIVIEEVATGVVGDVVTVKVDESVVGFGEKLPPAPAGKPLADRVTGPAPPDGATVTA